MLVLVNLIIESVHCESVFIYFWFSVWLLVLPNYLFRVFCFGLMEQILFEFNSSCYFLWKTKITMILKRDNMILELNC